MSVSNEVLYYEFGKYLLDVVNFQLLKNEKPIQLTHKSIEILIFLIENREKTLGKDEIFRNVWAGSFVEESNLTQHIYRIRKALEDTENGEIYIETIPKYGYRFIGEVKEIFDKPISDQTDQTIYDESTESETNVEEILTKTDSENTLDISVNKTESSINNRPKLNSTINIKLIFAVFVGAVLMFVFTQINQQYLPQTKSKSVVVLPFKYIGSNKDEKLELGVADTLISKLGRFSEYSVIPTESIVSYTKTDFQTNNQNLFEIANKLGADIVLTGTIQREENTVRFSIRYYSVKEKQQLCTMKFDEEFSDIFTLQDSISEKAVNKLSFELEEHFNSPTHTEIPHS